MPSEILALAPTFGRFSLFEGVIDFLDLGDDISHPLGFLHMTAVEVAAAHQGTDGGVAESARTTSTMGVLGKVSRSHPSTCPPNPNSPTYSFTHLHIYPPIYPFNHQSIHLWTT